MTSIGAKQPPFFLHKAAKGQRPFLNPYLVVRHLGFPGGHKLMAPVEVDVANSS